MINQYAGPARFKVMVTDASGKEIVVAEGIVTSYNFRTQASPVSAFGCFSVVEYIPQPMEFSLQGLVYPAEEAGDEVRPMTGTNKEPEVSQYDDSDFSYDDDY